MTCSLPSAIMAREELKSSLFFLNLFLWETFNTESKCDAVDRCDRLFMKMHMLFRTGGMAHPNVVPILREKNICMHACMHFSLSMLHSPLELSGLFTCLYLSTCFKCLQGCSLTLVFTARTCRVSQIYSIYWYMRRYKNNLKKLKKQTNPFWWDVISSSLLRAESLDCVKN